MMQSKQVLTLIDRFTELLGRGVAWLTFAMVLLMCLVVLLRYGFDVGSIALQESVTYLHAMVFMLAAGYTLKHGGHVRVDIFYRHFSPQKQAWVNCVGILVFLLPLCGVLFFLSLDFVGRSWSILEVSREPGGIPAVFLLKSLIPLFALCLGLQGIGEFLKGVHILLGETEAPASSTEDEADHA